MKKILDWDLTTGLQQLKVKSEVLTELLDDLKIPSPEKENVVAIFEHLFPGRNKGVPDRRSIIHPDKFDLYFDNALNSEGILFKEVTPVLGLNWEEIKPRIEKWLREGKEGYLIEILSNVDEFEGRIKFENVSKIIVTLINAGIRTQYLLENWLDSISKNAELIERYYGDDREFFRKLFRPNKGIFFHDTYVLRLIFNKNFSEKTYFFPLDVKELQDISIIRLKDYVDSRTEFDIRVFFRFYYNCWKELQGKNIIILEEANKIVREYIEKFPVDYLRFAIRSKSTPHFDDEYIFLPYTDQYFNSWDLFEDWLQEQIKKHNEFYPMIKYFQDFKKNEYDFFYSEERPQWIELDSNGNSSYKYFRHQTYEGLGLDFSSRKYSQ